VAAKFEKLAGMMNDGFNALDLKINSIGDELGEGISNLERGQAELIRITTSLERGQENLVMKTAALERGQEDILLKLDNFAYKFEVVELKKRMTRAEGRLNQLEAPGK
jgi:hypothetical protein